MWNFQCFFLNLLQNTWWFFIDKLCNVHFFAIKGVQEVRWHQPKTMLNLWQCFRLWERERFPWYSAHLKRRFRQLRKRCCFQNLILSNFCLQYYFKTFKPKKTSPPLFSLFFQIIQHCSDPHKKKRTTLFRKYFLWQKKQQFGPLLIIHHMGSVY